MQYSICSLISELEADTNLLVFFSLIFYINKIKVLIVLTNGPGVEDLSEVQVDPEADGDEIGEQQDEPKPVIEAVS